MEVNWKDYIQYNGFQGWRNGWNFNEDVTMDGTNFRPNCTSTSASCGCNISLAQSCIVPSFFMGFLKTFGLPLHVVFHYVSAFPTFFAQISQVNISKRLR